MLRMRSDLSEASRVMMEGRGRGGRGLNGSGAERESVMDSWRLSFLPGGMELFRFCLGERKSKERFLLITDDLLLPEARRSR